MNFSNYRLSLDIHETESGLSLRAKKGDTIRKIYVTLMDGGVPYRITQDCTAAFTARKPDNSIIFNDALIENNAIVYELTPQTTSAAGQVRCEVRLYGGDGRLITSPRFFLDVDDTVFTEGDEVVSEDEYTILEDALAKVDQAVKDAEDKVDRIAADFQTKVDNGEFTDAVSNAFLHKSGGTMSGPINMGGNKITGLGNPTSDRDAVPKSYADDIKETAEAALPKAGGTMTGAIAMGGNKITGLGTPANDGDAVPKSYAVARKELASMSHSQLDANGNVTLDTITAYPTSPGVYRVGSAGDMPVPGKWGNLIIYNSGYVTHIFENGDGFWVQRTGSISGVTKDNWRRLPAMKTTTATILASSWSGNNAWAEATGVKTTSTVIVSPAYGNRDNYIHYGLMCISQPADGYLEFYCDTVPGVDITVNVLILD